jgi:hypothetical protein
MTNPEEMNADVEEVEVVEGDDILDEAAGGRGNYGLYRN